MKIQLKNTPEQRELLYAVIHGEPTAKATLQAFLEPVLKEILLNQNLNEAQCDWLPVEELEVTVKLEIPFKIKGRRAGQKEKTKIFSGLVFGEKVILHSTIIPGYTFSGTVSVNFYGKPCVQNGSCEYLIDPQYDGHWRVELL